MATAEQIAAQLQVLIIRQQASEQELLRFREENQRLGSMAASSLPALVAALEKGVGRSQGRVQEVSSTAGGRGKPPTFKGGEGDWPECAGKFANYISAVYE